MKYFTHVLQQVQKGIVENTRLALQSPKTLESDSLLTGLINEIATISQPFAIALDDYHVINEPAIQQIILFLLDNQPSQMHLIISSWADPPWPLAQLRARGEVEEIRVLDLRFTLDETITLLNEIMGLALFPEDIVAIEKRTEGWVAGLQMVAIALQNEPTPFLKNTCPDSCSGHVTCLIFH